MDITKHETVQLVKRLIVLKSKTFLRELSDKEKEENFVDFLFTTEARIEVKVVKYNR